MDLNDHNNVPFPTDADAPRPTKQKKTPVASASGEGTQKSLTAIVTQKQRLTLSILDDELKRMGYTIRFNILLKRAEVIRYKAKGKREKMSLDSFVTVLHSAIGGLYSNSGFDTLERYISKIAEEHEYNPVIEYFDKIKWDKKSRLPEIYAILRIPDTDTLSRALVKKWFLQTAAMPYNEVPTLDDKYAVQAYGAEGVLTLQGEQGAGKTSFFRKIALHWFVEGARLDDNDKDLRRRAITAWITELGEVESTFKKSSVETLKSFITMSYDQFRLPYGRSDIEGARLTSLCATCNGTGFLADETGNRRWFIVPLGGKIDLDALDRLDVDQLWAEFFEQVRPMTQKQRASCFRLSADERKALDARNTGYMKPIVAQEDVKLLLDEAEGNPIYSWKLLTPKEWLEENRCLSRYSPVQIGKALKAIGREKIHTNTGNRYSLPVQKIGFIPQVVAEVKDG